MMDFKVMNSVPPGGKYFYEIPETRTYIEDYSLTTLMYRVNRHYAENNIKIPANLPATVRDYMCQRLPRGFCNGENDGRAPVRVYTMAEIREITRISVREAKLVAPGVATQRAQICAACKQNDRSACPTCSGAVAWAVRAVGGRSTGMDQVLGICSSSGNLVAALVFVETGKPTTEHPENCWRLK